MKILVTGGAGFIGSHLVERLLARGDRIVVLDDFNDFYDPALKRANAAVSAGNPAYRLVEGDIRDRALVFRLFAEEHFDAVVHLAARAGVRPSLTQPVLYEEVNCVATLHLLEAAVAHGRPRFVFASSSSVYGVNSKLPFSEEDPIERPVSPYATTKRAGELHVFTTHHLHGLPAVCLRFFTVYGPRQRPDMAFHRFLRGAVRVEEIIQSMRILDQALKQIPPGPVMHQDPRISLPPKSETYNSIEAMIAHFKIIMDGIHVPPGEVYSFTEAGNGELGFYIVSDGTGRPWKCRVRPPCFSATAVLGKVLPGLFIADVVPTFGMINMIGGECDR